MTKDYVLKFRRTLVNHECYGEKDLEKLLSSTGEIKQIISILEDKKPADAYSLQNSYGQLLESEGYLQTWVRKPKKGTMRSTFIEYKRDFISVLDDYIELGDKYNLWENDSDSE